MNKLETILFEHTKGTFDKPAEDLIAIGDVGSLIKVYNKAPKKYRDIAKEKLSELVDFDVIKRLFNTDNYTRYSKARGDGMIHTWYNSKDEWMIYITSFTRFLFYSDQRICPYFDSINIHYSEHINALIKIALEDTKFTGLNPDNIKMDIRKNE